MWTPPIGGGAQPPAGSSIMGSKGRRTYWAMRELVPREKTGRGKMSDPQDRFLALIKKETDFKPLQCKMPSKEVLGIKTKEYGK